MVREGAEGARDWRFGIAGALEELGAPAEAARAEGDTVRGPEGRLGCPGRTGKIKMRSRTSL